jgi:uncharacterized protein (DUF934 family)
MERQLKIIPAAQLAADEARVLRLANDADPRTADLAGVERVELDFPKFSDGRAFTQAYLLRRRLGFTGDIRAVGDVLVDQLVQMERSGFSSAVLKDGKDPAEAERQFARYARYYQGDVKTDPLFKAIA